jgi:sporulation protein YlmC with PRC-barrel domain
MRKLYVGRNVLDHQLLDHEGRRCGNVDDLAIEGGPGERAFVVAILSGPGYWPQRAGLLGRIAGWIGRSGRTRIPWDQVERIDSGVHLRRRAPDYGLGKGDDRLRPYIERVPGANR